MIILYIFYSLEEKYEHIIAILFMSILYLIGLISINLINDIRRKNGKSRIFTVTKKNFYNCI